MSPVTTNVLTAIAVFSAVTALAMGLRYFAIRALRRWDAATTSPFSQVMLESFRFPSLIWCVLIGL